MKQLLQNVRDGKTIVVDVPVPAPRRGTALIKTSVSLVSSGTERMVIEFAEKNLIDKARSRPDLVRQLIDKARNEGVINTIEAAFNRLDQPMALGYSSAGTITSIGEGLQGYKIGDRVACSGGGYAVHAEYAIIPQNLLTPIPDHVDFESAAFTTLGAIALHGFRLAKPQIGEQVAVIGLGLLGLISVEIARAAGCSVFGVDTNPARVQLGARFGAVSTGRSDAETSGMAFTQGRGFDIVLICADTKSDDPVELAGRLSRDRGRVIAVGAVGMNIPRKIYYEKEISFHISRSYGPGRYDPSYEENGRDYPYGYVRWTEGRNFSSFVSLLANKQVDIHPLITHTYNIENAAQAYELITGKKNEDFLGVVISYPHDSIQPPSTKIDLSHPLSKGNISNQPGLSIFGAGNYATGVFLPAVVKTGPIVKRGIVSAGGLNAQVAAKRFGFAFATSVEQEILEDSQTNIVAILSRHSLHARQVMEALHAGKNVYCEKPLALSKDELDSISKVLSDFPDSILTVGFNRRFAPLALEMKAFLEGSGEPLVACYRVNAGFLPLTHWLHDPQQGGGRIIGEGCHFVDFLSFLVGEPPKSVSIQAIPDSGRYRQDNVIMNFNFQDGSIGTVIYVANGSKSYPKERVEVFCAGKVAVLDDFRNLELVRGNHRQNKKLYLRQDKGHVDSWKAFLNAVKNGGPPPIPYFHLFGVTRATIAAVECLDRGHLCAQF